jgi:hypothetical protein
MTGGRGEIAWGATIDATLQADKGMREWKVEIGSESLGSFAVEPTLTRFADDMSRLVPGAVPACSLTLGRFGMTLTITAPGPGEAADEAAELFRRILEAAVWPRSIPEGFTADVVVAPADGAPTDA